MITGDDPRQELPTLLVPVDAPAAPRAEQPRGSAAGSPGRPEPRGGGATLVTLPAPLRLYRVRTAEPFDLLATSPRGGVLRPGRGVDLPTRMRLALRCREGQLEDVRFVVELRERRPGLAPREAAFRWLAVTATGRRGSLAEALERVLRLQVRWREDRDELPPGRGLLYDARKGKIRSVALPGSSDAPPASAQETGELAAHAGPAQLRAGDPAGPRGEPAGGADPLSWLMFRRDPVEGECRFGRERRKMVSHWVGFNRCRFDLEGLEGPTKGTSIEVGVPTMPLVRGLVWMDGTVRLSSVDPTANRTLVEVEWEEAPSSLPTGYRAVVAYCRMQTLQHLRDKGVEPLIPG